MRNRWKIDARFKISISPAQNSSQNSNLLIASELDLLTVLFKLLPSVLSFGKQRFCMRYNMTCMVRI